MLKRQHIIISILVIIILVLAVAIANDVKSDNGNQINITRETIANDVKSDNGNQINITRETIANSSQDPGTVEVIRNIGNPDGDRIAYVVGVHPLEYQTHETLLKLLPNMTNLDCCYDIYIINVTQDVGHYGDGSSDNSQGRQNGQNLAYKYVYPEIADGNYKLAVDVHSNVGAYAYKTFVFSPLKESLSVKYAEDVAGRCENITYFAPDSTTSGPYLTIPLNENGVPAFYFEEYSFASQDVKDAHMLELIRAVDSLKFAG